MGYSRLWCIGAANDIWALRGVVHPSQQEPPCWVQLDIAGNPFSARKAHTVVGTDSPCETDVP